ncbi:MAG: exosortase/archaeosortase family protein [Candidatus Zipacnadales bacterium]
MSNASAQEVRETPPTEPKPRLLRLRSPSSGKQRFPALAGMLPAWAEKVCIAAAVVLLWMLYRSFINACVYAWRAEGSYFSHGFLVPVLAAGLVWLRRHELAKTASQPSNAGLAVLAVSLLLRWLVDYFDLQTGVALPFVIAIAGLVVLFRGWEILQKTWFPIAFLLFAVPISPAFTDPISFPMRIISTRLAEMMLNAVGMPMWATGTLMQFPNCTLVVPNACSGMQSLLALFAALAMFVYVVEGRWWKKAILLCCIPPMVLLANGIRLALIALSAIAINRQAAEGTVHEMTGILVFVLALLGLMAVARFVLRLEALAVWTAEEEAEDV